MRLYCNIFLDLGQEGRAQGTISHVFSNAWAPRLIEYVTNYITQYL